MCFKDCWQIPLLFRNVCSAHLWKLREGDSATERQHEPPTDHFHIFTVTLNWSLYSVLENRSIKTHEVAFDAKVLKYLLYAFQGRTAVYSLIYVNPWVSNIFLSMCPYASANTAVPDSAGKSRIQNNNPFIWLSSVDSECLKKRIEIHQTALAWFLPSVNTHYWFVMKNFDLPWLQVVGCM